MEISRAINAGSLVFIACFSENTERRNVSYQFEELRLATDAIRLRPPGQIWLIPVRFSACNLPHFDLGSNRTLDSLQRVDLFDDDSWAQGINRLVITVRRILGHAASVRRFPSPPDTSLERNSSGRPQTSPPIQGVPEASASPSLVTDFQHDVFILHAPADIDMARRIRFELETGEYDVCWDEGRLISSADFDELLGIIKKCRYLLIALSSAFVHSSLAHDELSAATIGFIEQSGVTILPLLYETCPIPVALETYEFADFTRSPYEGIGQVFEVLRSYELSTTEEAPPRAKRLTLRDAINNLIRLIREASELYLATDLGGTKAYMSLMTRSGDRLFDRKFPTQSHTDSAALAGFLAAKILESIYGVHETTGIALDDIKGKISAFGVAFAGPTDAQSGMVRDASNFTIKNFPLADILQKQLGRPVFIENDANLGVVGEAWKGVARDHRNVVGIIIGTGIGGGIVMDGQLYTGSNGAAGEIGHMVIDVDSNVTCGCGQRGCFEALASRRAIAQELARRKSLHGQSDIRWEENNLGSAELADYVAAGDPDAIEVMREASRIWGRAVRTLLNVLNPDIVFFGGGFVRQLGDRLGDSFLDPVRDEARKCMNSIYELGGERIPIVLGELDNPVLSGACLLAIRRSRGSNLRADIISTIITDLDELEIRVLESIYNYHPRLTRISRDPRNSFHEDRLRKLRNHGLIATSNGLPFRRAEHVKITELGRIATERLIASREI
jgi:glucokinase